MLVDAAWMNAQYYLRSHPQFNNLEQLSQLGITFLTTVHVGITVLATASYDNILTDKYMYLHPRMFYPYVYLRKNGLCLYQQ